MKLKKVSTVTVHFVLPSGFVGDLSELTELRVVEASIERVWSDKDLFNEVSKALKFPDYFGCNWDALNDCLTDLDYWLPAGGYVLILRGASMAWSQAPYTLGRLVTAWLVAAEYWAKDHKPFHLVFVM